MLTICIMRRWVVFRGGEGSGLGSFGVSWGSGM